MRGERRRQSRERQAAQMNAVTDHSAANLAQIAPILDEAINGLGADDRTAILLRFFEQRDWRAIGQTLGGNEDSARKRVARALEKLHAILKRRSVTFSAAALGTALAAGTVTAAPPGLAATVAGSALAAVAAGGASALTLLKIMAMTKLKIGIVGGLVAASLVTTLVIEQQALARLRKDDETLRLKAEATTKLNFSKNLILSFFLYEDKNQNQFPTNFDQAAPFLPPEATNQTSVTSHQFEILYHGPMNTIANPGNAIVIREKQAWQSDGKWSRTYAFADGHCEIHVSPDGNFEEWESRHLAMPSGQ